MAETSTAPPELVDIGVNLLHPQFDDDREAVLARARGAGIATMLITSTDLATSHRAVGYCGSHGLYCTAGVHPHDAKDAPADLAARLESLARQRVVRAIGETGLDYNRNFSPQDVQRRVFAQQLEVAARGGLPVFVHDRDSGGEVNRMIADMAGRLAGVVVHCFTGSGNELDAHLAQGFSIGITGWVCDPRRGAALAGLVPGIPADRLMVETDAPFLLPPMAGGRWPPPGVPGRHKRRNEPLTLPLVVARLAELRGEDPVELAATTARNARRLFRLPGQRA